MNPDTPLMKQHSAIKKKYPDAILLFRVGDFYETFNEDAIITSKVLGIMLTKRNNKLKSSGDLAGFPHHALDTYLHKLVQSGYRVAICDQLENPKMVQGIVKRGVTELVTPGVAIHEKLLDNKTNNFLAAIHILEGYFGIAFLDVSTGEFFLTEGTEEYIAKTLFSFSPSEIILSKKHQKKFSQTFDNKFYTYAIEDWIFESIFAKENMLRHFQTHSLKGFGIENLEAGIVAASAILYYLKDTEHPNFEHITSIQRLDKKEYLWMDSFTIRNLELVSGNKTLLEVIDETYTSMGARQLKRWILMPLSNREQIHQRLEMTAYLFEEKSFHTGIQDILKNIGDIERLVAKIPLKKINPREVLQIGKSLSEIKQLQQLATQCNHKNLRLLLEQLQPCEMIADTIGKMIVESAPILVQKGAVIKHGINKELDELRDMLENNKLYLQYMQEREALDSGINSLKIGSNNVFGYYFEVTNNHKEKVPDTWIRKQTLANCERYITPELKEYEQKIFGAEEKILSLEIQVYEQLLISLYNYILPIQQNAQLIATIDCLQSFATIAYKYNYCKPQVLEEEVLNIMGGRHPVIENTLPTGELYIPNDILMNKENQQIIILTGPNMSGKSALLRQTALIILLAHMGSFVPATFAKIPFTDSIFTRVGALDNLAAGESTFMVEMNETANILNNVTPHSFILLDEIGRGTSTYDGISIAWSIAEYLHEHSYKPLTLFATHYHELNNLENTYGRIKNYHISYEKKEDKIIFLRTLALGGTTHSFGIHVARMTGMPKILIDRAEQILKDLEKNRDKKESLSIQQTLLPFSTIPTSLHQESAIENMLKKIDINIMTPVEALLKIQELKKSLIQNNLDENIY
ncbi:MAG: DNA mismatch repair protein MutS [Chitinophagaceae bacterium]